MFEKVTEILKPALLAPNNHCTVKATEIISPPFWCLTWALNEARHDFMNRAAARCLADFVLLHECLGEVLSFACKRYSLASICWTARQLYAVSGRDIRDGFAISYTLHRPPTFCEGQKVGLVHRITANTKQIAWTWNLLVLGAWTTDFFYMLKEISAKTFTWYNNDRII